MQEKWKSALGPTLLASMEESGDPWGVKDNCSVFVYASPSYKKLLGLGDNFDVEGRMDHELPAPTAKFAECFVEHDRKTERLRTTLSSLEVHPFGKEKTLQAYCFKKTPCISSGGLVIGTVFQGFSLSCCYTRLALQINKLVNGQKATDGSWTIGSHEKDRSLTHCQHEVVFLLCLGFSPKKISERLKKSERTIRNHLEHIRENLGAENIQQLKENAWQRGWINTIPPRLLYHCSILIH